jgi:hypothetical protein
VHIAECAVAAVGDSNNGLQIRSQFWRNGH